MVKEGFVEDRGRKYWIITPAGWEAAQAKS
jgi:predicted transcriptional regulator